MEESAVTSLPAPSLLQKAKSGDFAAFQELIGTLQPRVYSVCYRILRQQQDAEDAVQQTFVAIIEHLDDFREESSLLTWVLRIASNNALKTLRKKRGLKTTSLDRSDEIDRYGDLPHPEFIAPWQETAEEIFAKQEVQEELEKALDELDEKYRTVFVLRDIEGLSVRDTAEALELSESAVKVRLLRARLALREMLTRKFGDPQQVVVPNHKHV